MGKGNDCANSDCFPALAGLLTERCICIALVPAGNTLFLPTPSPLKRRIHTGQKKVGRAGTTASAERPNKSKKEKIKSKKNTSIQKLKTKKRKLNLYKAQRQQGTEVQGNANTSEGGIQTRATLIGLVLNFFAHSFFKV